MYELLSKSQQDEFVNIFSGHFSLFSEQSDNFITIVKQPIQQINNSNQNVFPGYGADTQNISDITYSDPITGVYPAIIIYPQNMDTAQFGQLKFDIDSNNVIIKVKEDCKDFILTDKTEKIIIDGQFWNPELSYKIQSFLGLRYYYFKLTITK